VISGKGRRGIAVAGAAAHSVPRTRPQTVPAVTPQSRATRAGPGREARAECADRRMKITATGPERRALSRLAPPASTVLRTPLRRTRLRRAVDPGASASPAGLTARARPQARPERRAANLWSAAAYCPAVSRNSYTMVHVNSTRGIRYRALLATMEYTLNCQFLAAKQAANQAQTSHRSFWW
jgi:hypothetical protein